MGNSADPRDIEPDRHRAKRRIKRRVKKRRAPGIRDRAKRRVHNLERQIQQGTRRIQRRYKLTGRRLRHRTTRSMKKVNLRILMIVVLAAGLLGVGTVGGRFLHRRRAAHRGLVAAQAALQAEDWEAACRHLKVYLFKYPNDVEMLARFAEANLSVRPLRPTNIGAAVGAYLRGLRIKPGDAEFSDRLARLYFSLEDYAQAVEVCRGRLAVAPEDARARMRLGRALVAQGKVEQGVQFLTRFVEAHPQEVEIYGILSDIALEQGSDSPVEEALAWLDRAVRNNPKSAEARARLARFYQRVKRDLDAARTNLEVADASGAVDLKTLLLLAEGWLDLGELDRAERELEAIRQLDREILTGYDLDLENLALALFTAEGNLVLRRGEEASGVELADSALEELTGDRRVLFLPVAVDLYLAAGRIEAARKCVDEYRRAVEARSKPDPSLSNQLVLLRAAIANGEDMPHLVINLLAGLVVGEPVGGFLIRGAENVQVWKLLAQAYSRTGQDSRALAALEKYVLRRPGDWEATLELARAYYRDRRFVRARKYAEDAERIRPDDLETKLFRIRASFKYVLEDSAEPSAGGPPPQELLALREAHPRNVEIRLLQAMVASGRGRHAEAVAELERAIAECDDPLPASMRLVELHDREGDHDKAIEVCEAAVSDHAGVAAPRIALAELQAKVDRAHEADKTLALAVAELEGPERVSATYARVRHMLLHGQRAAGIGLLEQLAADRPSDEGPRLALLRLPEIQEDNQASQGLIDELRAIEGDWGVRWRFAQARKWLQQDDWTDRQAAITDMLQRCIEADPRWPAPIVALGRMYERLEQDDKAEQTYRRFFDNYPGQSEVVIRLLELLERQRRFIAASKILERVPAGLSALSAFRIRAAIGRGDYDAAIQELRERIGADPDDAIARVVLARLIYHHAREADLALEMLDEARRLDPNLILAASSRATILHAEGRDDEVLAFLDAEVARRNDYAAYLLRAGYCAEAGQFELAEKDYVHLTTFPESAADGYERLGEFYERAGKVDKAAAAWEAGLKIEPDRLRLQRLLIRALVTSPQAQPRERGRRMLDDALKQWPDDPGFLSVRAALLLSEDTPAATQEAMRVLERVVQVNPRDIVAHLHLIERAREWGDLERASRLADRALGANPESAHLLSAKASLERQLDNVRIAWQLAATVMKIDPENVTARILLVYLALRTGQNDVAQKYSDEAMALDPANEEVQLTRALVLNARDQRDQAIQSLEAYRQSDTDRDSVRVLVLLSDLYRFQGDVRTAEERVVEVEALAPGDPAVFLARLRCLATEHRYDEVLVRYSERRRTYPDESQVLLSVASIMAYAPRDHYVREARSLYHQLIATNPDCIDGHLGLGQVAYQLGDIDVARQAYRDSLNLDAYHAKALNNLAWILGVDSQEFDEALELANRGVLRYPEDPHLLDTRGTVLLRLGKYSEARRDFEKSLTLLPATAMPSARARTLVNLARAHLKLRELPPAGSRLNQALQIDRQHDVFNTQERAEIHQLIEAARKPA